MPRAAQNMAQVAYQDNQQNGLDDEPEEPHYTEEDTMRYPNRRSKAQRSSAQGDDEREYGEYDDGGRK